MKQRKTAKDQGWHKGMRTPNPNGRRGKQRKDAWTNPITGLYTARDKRIGGRILLNVVTEREAQDLWRGSDMAARIVESAPGDAIRGGFEIKVDDKELAEETMAMLEEMQCPSFIGKGAHSMFQKAREFRAAYGGCAIFPVINDSRGSLDQPLDEKRIGKISHLMLFEPRELTPLTYYTDPANPKFGEVEVWQLMPITNGHISMPIANIHESRMIIVQGTRVSREDNLGGRQGWGDSVFTRVLAAINDFELAYGNASALIQDFSQGVLKLEGWGQTNAIGGAKVGERLELMNLMRSSMRALVMGAGDDFTRQTTSVTGLSDLLDRFMYRLAAAVPMPVTKLMGMSPAGLNATGESDEANWHQIVGVEQRDMTPMVEQLIRFLFLSAEGPTGGEEPDQWSIEWLPLSQPSAKETAETQYLNAQRDEIWINTGVISPDDAAESHFKGDTYSPDIVVDFAAREKQAALMPTPAELAAAQVANAQKPVEKMPKAGSEEPKSGSDGEVDNNSPTSA